MKALIRRWSRNRPGPNTTPQAKRRQRILQLQQQLPDATPQQCDLIASVESLTMTSPERILAACQAIEHVARNSIPGDVVECGVWRGGSMVAMAQTLIGLNDLERNLWLYDTFDGMSQPTQRDVDFMGRSAKQLLANEAHDDELSIWCYSPLAKVQDTMAGTGYPDHRLHFVKGKVEITLPRVTPNKIAVLRLDTDWYESTRCELEYLFPLMSRGGVIIIDDYGHWEGCRRAVDEYFQEHDVQIFLQRIDYTGRMGVVAA